MNSTSLPVVAIKDAVLAKYGSLQKPQFDFVRAALAADEYRPLVRRLQSLFEEVKEDTDPNDDVSFVFILHSHSATWVLQISMVGPYAVLLGAVNGGSVQVVNSHTAQTSEEQHIFELLREYAVEPLTLEILNAPIALRLQNTQPKQCRLYQALFSDSEILPWEWRG